MILSTIISLEAKEISVKDTYVTGTHVKDTRVNDPNVKEARNLDLGTYGETFPIQEPSLLDIIRAKLQKLSESGKLEDHQQTILKVAKEQLNRPTPVKGIVKTTTPKSFAYDPSITVPYDLKDHNGNVFQKKGTRVNPLDTHSFSHPLLFVDGDDSEQVAWAIQEHQAADTLHKPKIILIQGAPFELSQKLSLPIYFDQSGVLIKKFGITQVPARVLQEGKRLLIEEVNTEQNK